MIVPPKVVPVIAPFTVKLVKPLRFDIVAFTVLIEFDVILPDTVIAVKFPRLVILANAPAPSVPLNVPPVIVPGTFRSPINAVTLLNVFDVTFPDTVRFVKVPT